MKIPSDSHKYKILNEKRRLIKKSFKLKPQIITLSTINIEQMMKFINQENLIPAAYNESTNELIPLSL